MAGAKKKNPDDVKMSLGDHLEDLRKRLLLGLIGPFIIFVVAMIYGDVILSWLLRPAIVAMRSTGQPWEIVDTQAGGAFTVYIKISFITALVVGIPWIFYQLWKFVAPGLYANERTLVYKLIPGSAALSILGVLFMYYVMMPVVLFFLFQFPAMIPMPNVTPNELELVLMGAGAKVHTTDDGRPPVKVQVLSVDPVKPQVGDMWVKVPENELCVELGLGEPYRTPLTKRVAVRNMPDISSIIDMMIMMALAFAVAFQTPMVMLTLGWIGLFDHKQFGSIRKFALLGCVILGAVLTPGGEVFSMLLLSFSIYALYEFGILLVWWVGRKKQPSDAATGE